MKSILLPTLFVVFGMSFMHLSTMQYCKHIVTKDFFALRKGGIIMGAPKMVRVSSSQLVGHEGLISLPHDHFPHSLHEVAFLQKRVMLSCKPTILSNAGNMEDDPVLGCACRTAGVPTCLVQRQLFQEAVTVATAEVWVDLLWQQLQEWLLA